MGAVSLPGNRVAYRLVVDVTASRAWISNLGIFRCSDLWRDRRRGFVVRRAKVISASREANGIVHLRRCSWFHGAVFPGDHGIRRNFEPLDRRFGPGMV